MSKAILWKQTEIIFSQIRNEEQTYTFPLLFDIVLEVLTKKIRKITTQKGKNKK